MEKIDGPSEDVKSFLKSKLHDGVPRAPIGCLIWKNGEKTNID